MSIQINFISIAVLLLLASLNVSAEDTLWQPTDSEIEGHYQLNNNQLSINLGLVNSQYSGLRQKNALELTLPLPDGRFTQVEVTKDLVVAEGLLKKYPELVTWKLTSLDDITASGRIDFIGQQFHAILTLKNGKTVYINPDKSTKDTYSSFYKPTQSSTQRFSCEAKQVSDLSKIISNINDQSTTEDNIQQRSAISSRTAKVINTYRIAIATTGEYAANFASKAEALQSVVTVLNRVNEIYQRDLSIRLILIENNDEIIFTDAASDPYDETDSFLYVANQTVIDQVIGVDNYDVGHLFVSSGGGLASIASVCNQNYKAQALTGFTGEINDTFSIDYFAHELGHQFGGTHTYSGISAACQGVNPTAYEPGSGSTIMAYAGLCEQDDLQTHTDAMFHGGSILQIKDYAFSGGGLSCAAQVDTENNDPLADAGRNYIIPSQTPFILTGTAIDNDPNNTMTYSWEQFNSGVPTALGDDAGDNAIIRTYLPISSPVRVIPKRIHLIGNVSSSEQLPLLARSSTDPLRFIFVARDGQGGVDIDQMNVEVTSDGPFVITSHQLPIVEYMGEQVNITWDVAGTDQLPIDCQSVDISVSTDQAVTFRALLMETANDGSAMVSLPNDLVASNSVRYKVQCSNNIFFALSPVDTELAFHPYLQVSSPILKEGDAGIQTLFFEVSLTESIGSDVSFQIHTQDETAISGEDYTSLTGRATIRAGDKSVLVAVQINGDEKVEERETFQLVVDNITTDAVLHYPFAIGTGSIIDDDVMYTLNIADAEILEGDTGGIISFIVSLSEVMSTDVVIPYQVLEGTASASEVMLNTGSVTISQGKLTAEIVVGITGDTQQETDESFTVRLEQPINNNVLLQDAIAEGIIFNDDLLVNPQLSLDSVMGETGSFEVQLDFKVEEAVSADVSYEVIVYLQTDTSSRLAGTATTEVKGILRIPAGSTNVLLDLPLETPLTQGLVVDVIVQKRGGSIAIIDEERVVTATNLQDLVVSNGVVSTSSGGGGSLDGFILLFFMLYLLRSIGIREK